MNIVFASSDNWIAYIVLGISIVIAVLTVVTIIIVHHLNYFLSKTFEINISRIKGIKNGDDALDYFIMKFDLTEVENHLLKIENRKQEKLGDLDPSSKKYKRILKRFDKKGNKAFILKFYRLKTRYQQIDYERSSYKIKEYSYILHVKDSIMKNRINFVKNNGNLVTFSKYNDVDQRKALTKEMREYVKKRDNYTCQICGKYMPDEVGLHIDHIIPVSRGGKSVISNLQVLCSKCNGKKGNKKI